MEGLRNLARDARGAVAVEFALVLPLLLLGFLGCLELALLLFIGSSVEAAIFEATRFGTIDDTGAVGRGERVVQVVEERTYGLLDRDRVTLDTLVYRDFADIGQPEPYTDANGNGMRDAGEAFSDINGNAQWDRDMGRAGLGGPGDVVVYRVGYAWGILTPVARRLMGAEIRQTASAAVRNKPF